MIGNHYHCIFEVAYLTDLLSNTNGKERHSINNYKKCISVGNAGSILLCSLLPLSLSPSLSSSLSISRSLCVHRQPTQQPCLLTLLCKIREKGPTCFHSHMCPERLCELNSLLGEEGWTNEQISRRERRKTEKE